MGFIGALSSRLTLRDYRTTRSTHPVPCRSCCLDVVDVDDDDEDEDEDDDDVEVGAVLL